jgi:hypothetical protein
MTYFPFPTTVDASMRSTFASCPRQFFFNYVMRRTTPGTSIHLTFGGAMARALEVFRLQFYQENEPFKRALDAGLQAGIAHWAQEQTPFDTGESPKTITSLVTATENYFKFFDPHTDYVTPFVYGDGKRAVEFTFAIPLRAEDGFPLHPETGLPILYSGRFDMLGQTKSGANFIVDDKTTSQLGMHFTKSMRLRSQFTGYTWACKQFGIPTQGILIRASCIKKTGIDYQEITETRPNHVVDQWYAQLKMNLWFMVGMWKNYNELLLNTRKGETDLTAWEANLDDSCGSYGGCQYMDACLSPKPIETVQAFFVPNTWDPLHKSPAAP